MNLTTWPENWGRWRTRRIRRGLVVLMAILLGLAFLSPLPGILCAVLYFPLTRSGIPPLDNKAPVDERQWRIRAEATIIAYRILAFAAILLVAVQPAGQFAWNRTHFAMLVLVVCLPAAVLAWREPDTPSDEA